MGKVTHKGSQFDFYSLKLFFYFRDVSLYCIFLLSFPYSFLVPFSIKKASAELFSHSPWYRYETERELYWRMKMKKEKDARELSVKGSE